MMRRRKCRGQAGFAGPHCRLRQLAAAAWTIQLYGWPSRLCV